MTNLLSSAQMRAIETATIASGAVTGLELMERAGRGVVQAILAEWPGLATGGHRALVLCGPGNNGGDGFVVARLLHEAGWSVEVFLFGDAARLPPDAATNHGRWMRLGEVAPLQELNIRTDAQPGHSYDVIVDALFGIGLRRALPDPVSGVFCGIFRGYLDGPVVAVDVPSGLCSDSGRPLVPGGYDPKGWPALDGLVAEASLTVTFHARKPGHVLAVGPRHCGKVVVADIGLPPDAIPDANPAVVRLVDAGTQAVRSGLSKGAAGHKFDHGHALILSGGVGNGGAARLAARGALRVGAGLVTVGCPPAALIENAARLNAVMLRPVQDGGALAEMLADMRITALCLGPGMGVDRAARLLPEALARGVARGDPQGFAPRRRGVVIDADALTALAKDPVLFGLLHDRCVLTPHGGEFARLFPDLAVRLEAVPLPDEPGDPRPVYSRIDAVRDAAARSGAVVLLKGPDTVIASPTGICVVHAAIHDRAAPWLATAGSGDVLSGIIAGLLARGFSPLDAAGTGTWLHVEAAIRFGPGLIAEDLPDMLPAVFRSLAVQ